MSKKKIFWIIVILLLGWGGYAWLKPKTPTTVYTTADVQKGDLRQTVSVTGNVDPNEQIDLSFKTSGKIKSISVDVGDVVSAGQVLAVIEKGTLLAQLSQAQHEVGVQKNTLRNMKNSPSSYKYFQKQAQEERIQSAEASVRAIVSQINDTTLISLIDGIVIDRSVDAEENVAMNSPVVTVAKQNDLIIFSNVPESDIAKLSTGQKADITLDAFGDNEVFVGTVTSIDPASTVVQDVVYYRIKLSLDNLQEKIKAGMTANIDVRTAEKKNVLMIPMRAVQYVGKQATIEVMLDEVKNVTEKRNITIGLSGDDGMVEILSGVKAGEKVVTFSKTQ
jgi:HlyD family secretion protein